MAAICSPFVGSVHSLAVSSQSKNVRTRGVRVSSPMAVAVEPPRTNWGTVQPFPPAGQEKKVASVAAERRMALKKLETRLRTAAADAAERIMHHEPQSLDSRSLLFSQHRSRMASWWRDHLAIRAETTEVAIESLSGSSDEEADVAPGQTVYPSMGGKSREAEMDRTRASLREFYYPRSNPQPFI
jgi:hypothetical protein